jgi:hypothetical protein
MSKLLKVAEGILDSAASECLEDNLSSTDSVQAYAENGCDVNLSGDEAKVVLEACIAWVDGTESGKLNGTNDYYYTVTKPLLGEDALI